MNVELHVDEDGWQGTRLQLAADDRLAAANTSPEPTKKFHPS